MPQLSSGSTDAERALVFVGVSTSERRTIPVGTRWDLTEERFASAGCPPDRPPGTHGRARLVLAPQHAWGGRTRAGADLDRRGADHRRGPCLGRDERLVVGPPCFRTTPRNASELHRSSSRRRSPHADTRSGLAASRRRIVTASDEARRRIERDLHDGTQQRLVSLQLVVRAAEARVEPEQPDLQRRALPRRNRPGRRRRGGARDLARDPPVDLFPRAASARRCARSRVAPRSRLSSRLRTRPECPSRSRSRPTSSPRRRWPTQPSTRRPRRSMSLAGAGERRPAALHPRRRYRRCRSRARLGPRRSQ